MKFIRVKAITTTELTANKKFKKLVKENIKNISSAKKNHVPWIGNVTILRDSQLNILGKYFREEKGMTLLIN